VKSPWSKAQPETEPPLQLYRCGHCEAMFEEVASLEAHIDACAGNEAVAQEGS